MGNDSEGSELGYFRDASWYSKPDTRAPKRLHRESEDHPGTPACNPNLVLLVIDNPVALDQFPTTGQCKRCWR